MLRDNIDINKYADYTLFFIKNQNNKVEAITTKQAKQKKAMKLLGIWIDGAYWNEATSQLQVMLMN